MLEEPSLSPPDRELGNHYAKNIRVQSRIGGTYSEATVISGTVILCCALSPLALRGLHLCSGFHPGAWPTRCSMSRCTYDILRTISFLMAEPSSNATLSVSVYAKGEIISGDSFLYFKGFQVLNLEGKGQDRCKMILRSVRNCYSECTAFFFPCQLPRAKNGLMIGN